MIIWPYKLILYHRKASRPGEFFNLATDPHEKHLLREDKKAKRLRKALREWRAENKEEYLCPDFGGAAAPDLRALGYIR